MTSPAPTRPYLRWLPGPVDAFVVVLAAMLVVTHTMWTHDTWWQLSIGEAIVRDHRLPTVDWLSWTGSRERVVVNYAWLSYALFGLGERASGLGLVEVGGGLLVALTLRLVYALARALGAAAVPAAVAVYCFALSSHDLLILRPQLFTFMFFAGFFFAYLELRRGRAKAISLTPVAIVLWANLHGGFLLGLVFLAGTAALEAFEAWRGDTEARGRARLLATVAIVSVATACLNPSGPRNYLDTFEGSFHEPFAKNVNEWLPPDLRETPLLGAVPVVAVACALALPAAPPLFEALAVLASLGLAFAVWRHVPLLWIAGGPVLAAWATRALEARRSRIEARAGILVRLAKGAERLVGARDGGPGGWVAIAVAALLAGGHEVASPTDVLAMRAVSSTYPVAATTWVLAHDLRGPLFNSYMWGGFLGWRLAPRHKIYIDSRTSIFREIFREYLTVYAAGDEALPLLERRGVAWALLERESRLALRLADAPGWRRVYADDVAAVFVRRGGPSEGVAAVGSSSATDRR